MRLVEGPSWVAPTGMRASRGSSKLRHYWLYATGPLQRRASVLRNAEDNFLLLLAHLNWKSPSYAVLTRLFMRTVAFLRIVRVQGLG